jgi:penicillin amidase
MKNIFAAIACVMMVGCQPEVPPTNANQARIVRDNYGVPHIYSDSIYGLYYGYGFSVAQDRLFQMEMARRSTQGMVAEVLGPDYLDFDKDVRQRFDPSSIRNQIAALDARDADVFEGFAAGMNSWISEISLDPKRLSPKQFTDLGFQPTTWSAYDVAMIFVGTMANRFGDFNTELDNARILSSLTERHGEENARAIFNLLNPRFTANAPTTIPQADWDNEVPDNLQSGAKNWLQSDPSRLAFTGPVISGMSNCWVLGKDKVSGANAILVNGPQFGWFNPAYVYSVGLHGAGINVVGNTPFAYPMIMFGHNETITWGSTWGAGDIVDLFAEQLNPENPAQYYYRGEYRDLVHRIETIRVKGQQDVQLDVYRSVHGPIVHRDTDGTVAYAKHRAWDGEEVETLFAWLDATHAEDFEQWKAEAEKSAINVNMYFADVWGNIGYFFGGKYPQRVDGHDNRLPANGDGSMDWQDRLPPDVANPHVINPTSGYLANWNNKPGQGVMNPDFFFYSWSAADRVNYLQSILGGDRKFSADEAWGVIESSSFVDLHASYFLPVIDDAAKGLGDERLLAANDVLQSWDLQSRDDDFDGNYDGAATAIFRVFISSLLDVVLKDDLGDVFAPFSSTGYPAAGAPTGAGTNIQTGVKAIVESLNGNGGYDLLNGETPSTIVATALIDALDKLAADQGSDITAYQLPTATRPFHYRNFLGIPQADETELMTAPIEQNRGTENNLMIMKEGAIVAYEVTPPGQNGFVGADGKVGPHYDDQFDMYRSFEKKRMWFYDKDVAANAKSETIVSY